MGLGTHLWSLGPILHPETCVLVLDPYFGCPPCTKCAPGANRAPWCTGARSSVHPRRPEHAPRCTRPTCERRSLRPRWCVGTALQTGHCTHTTPPPGLTLGERGALREGGCAPRRGWVAGVDSHVGRGLLSTHCDKLITGAIIPALGTGSHQNSAVKRAWAGVVLGWVTSREVPVLHPFLVFRRASQCYLNKPFARLRSRRGRAGPGCAARTTARAGATPSAHPRRPEHTGHGATRALCAHPGAPEVLRAHPGEIGVHLGQCALGRVAHVGQGAR
ncbi:hypothetical protein SUGI_1363090 [Cryptomeria japonica]|uniref:Uncharacterized protein n=1 Tax=Cryptomeria japonica TaxID=3369 RepID=A0AAD3RQS5_CRYJA|nr:hypothetical protein SUGI_1363090 [Cryptomeria japonica]